ncbi:MAG TPA: histidine phosphatase family protein [Euzebyales bacterium]|nr:histidine phosphatase family protein [Euzebyales bacterium]
MSSPNATTEFRQHRFSLPPGATDILLIRHGESAPARLDAPAPTVDGQADPDLDARGRAEAERVADRLASEEVSAIYVSTLRRTAQTAAPLATGLGIEPRVEPDLREVHLGEWEGAVFRMRIAERDPLAMRMFTEQRWDMIPGAEASDVLLKRVRQAIERLAAAHVDQRVVAFTHGGVIAMLMHLATGSEPFAFLGVDNGSITHLVVTSERWLVRRFNDTGHLDTDLDRPPQPLV